MIVGIDTSCYTTSLAVIDNNTGDIIGDYRRLLSVAPGGKGLRQSEAVFQHLKNLPELLDNNFRRIKIDAVAVSTAPRPLPGSYLPVFKVGASFGGTIAKLLGIPVIKTSHQEGHIRAGIFNHRNLPERDFLTWHISGGTTELLLVKPDTTGYAIQKVGGSSDLQVGQFVDRVGVALGEAFPAGPYLEKRALLSNTTESLPVCTQGLTISFSGPASAARRLIDAGKNGDELAGMVFNCIIRSLLRVSARAAKEHRIARVLLVGGVASSQIIRDGLTAEGPRQGIEFFFGTKELSGDNAVGVGLIGFDDLRKGKLNG